MKTFRSPHRTLLITCGTLLALAVGSAAAKLPPLSDEAKAKAAENAAKAAHTGKMDAYKLCQSMDRVAAAYRASATKAGKPAPAAATTAPCADPGPFVYTPPAPAGAVAGATAAVAAAPAAPAPVKK